MIDTCQGHIGVQKNIIDTISECIMQGVESVTKQQVKGKCQMRLHGAQSDVGNREG